MKRREILKQTPDESHQDPYIHEVRHDLCVVGLRTLRIVISSLNRHSPGGLNQPAGKCPLAELGGFCGETEEAAFLRRYDRWRR